MSLDDDLATGAIALLYRLVDETLRLRGEMLEYIRRVEAEVARLREKNGEDQLKIDAWWRARAEVKIDGNSRAEYVLQRDAAWERADAAEREVARLREGLREIIAMGLPDQSLVVKARDLLAEDGAA